MADDRTLGILLSEIQVKAEYLHAGYNRVHMVADDHLEGLLGIDPLPNDATQLEANARTMLLRNALLEHVGEVGSATVLGEHLAEDPINKAALLAAPGLSDTSDLARCILLVNALNTANQKHATQPGVHFHDSVTTIGTPQYPLCHCSVTLTAIMDGMGGAAYSGQVLNISGGLSVDSFEFTPGTTALVHLTLPLSVATNERVIIVNARAVSNPPLDPWSPFAVEIGQDGFDASFAVPMGTIPVSTDTVVVGVTFIMSVASTPNLNMSIIPPVTLADVITDLNDLLVSMKNHFADA
jgi:hypothetical protein